MNNRDYLVIATAAEDRIRAYAAVTRDIAEEGRKAHDLSPIATAALGRLMTAGTMMGSMLKGDHDLLTLQIRGDGPMKGLTVTADSFGHVKGFVTVPDVMLPPSPAGKLDVGGAIGRGTLSVIRDLGLKEPYVGQVALQTGEIAEDLTYYYAYSEQTPSSIALGVLMEKNNTVRQSGGFMLQLMPGIEEEMIIKLEEKLGSLKSVTKMLEEGMTPEDMLNLSLSSFSLRFLETREISFYCNCSRERIEKVLLSVGREELQKMIEEGAPVEVRCQFCGRAYSFSTEEIKRLYRTAS